MTPNPDPQPQPFCMYCDLAIRKTRDATRNEWEHMDGFSFCKDGQHWAWPRTMNPDPQGGESNMTDEPKPRYDSASGEVTYVVGGIHYNSRAEANHYKPEGATTQPTPAVPKQNWRQFIDQLDGIEDSAHIEAKIRSRVDMTDATPDDWIWETLAFLEGRGFLASPAQPVPSAGSKPQEEGGTVGCWPRDRKPQWLLVYDDPERGNAVYDSAKEAQAAFDAASMNWTVTLFSPTVRPVADGGGLEAVYRDGKIDELAGELISVKNERDQLRELLQQRCAQLASSREALSVATAEVARLKRKVYFGNCKEFYGSPEGSSS